MITDERKQQIQELDECNAYFFIDLIGGILWRTRHDASHGRVNITPAMEQELVDMFEEQVFCIQQLSKFGVDPDSAKNRPNGDYWKWYEHWDNWKKAMQKRMVHAD
jgi:hypothetical protein